MLYLARARIVQARTARRRTAVPFRRNLPFPSRKRSVRFAQMAIERDAVKALLRHAARACAVVGGVVMRLLDGPQDRIHDVCAAVGPSMLDSCS